MFMIVLSALIYLAGFLYPLYLYPCMFLWMIPILYTDLDNRYTFKDGYVWGLVFFSGHLWWFAQIIDSRGQGDGRMIVYVITTLYFSLLSGFWLWLKQQLYRYVCKSKSLKENRATSFCTWVISTVTFIYLTCYCSLAMLDCFEGYFLANPLLPLVSWSWYLVPIYYIGTIGYWIIIVLVNLVIASLIRSLSIHVVCILLILLLFPIFFQTPQLTFPICRDQTVYLKPTWNDVQLTQAQKFYQISRQLDYIAMSNSRVKFVVMPESAFPYDLLLWEGRLSAWGSLFEDGVSIILGAHRYQDGKTYNCLYQIMGGEIVAYYDKTHLVPLVERVPRLFKFIGGFDCMFTSQEDVFSYPAYDQSKLLIAGCIPFICSELFCESKRPTGDKPILFICNDSWLGAGYAQQLARNSSNLMGLCYRVPILYVGSCAI